MQRRRLLFAIIELVAENGLESTSVGHVCERAGMSRRTFYEIFEDREACFLAALDVAVERIGDGVVEAYEGGGRWHKRIREALAILLAHIDLEPGLARLCLIETLKASPEIIEYRRGAIDKLIAAVDEGRGEASAGADLQPLTAESIVGGVIAVLQARLLEQDHGPIIELLNPLMSMIVHPYLGPAAARRQREQPVVQSKQSAIRENSVEAPGPDPFKDLSIRFTYRTAQVIAAIAAHPGASNREIGEMAGVPDQGQMSKLLRRLEHHQLISNQGGGRAKGEANAWRLTKQGRQVQNVVAPT
jgi:AcrR family transcriptional regulator